MRGSEREWELLKWDTRFNRKDICMFDVKKREKERLDDISRWLRALRFGHEGFAWLVIDFWLVWKMLSNERRSAERGIEGAELADRLDDHLLRCLLSMSFQRFLSLSFLSFHLIALEFLEAHLFLLIVRSLLSDNVFFNFDFSSSSLSLSPS